jgi:SAM-dependent methyltransferase
MFDWARGEVLRKLVDMKVPCASYEGFLKGWASAWPIALLNIPPGAKVLDVGCANDPYYARYFSSIGCEAHVLERTAPPGSTWGITDEVIKENPKITFHMGLAGEQKVPANMFDLITCISVLEHVYDHKHVIDMPVAFPHWRCLEDMLRMLVPGGVLVITYDFILHDYEGHRGWDYLADIRYMGLLGAPLLSNVRNLRDRTFIYNYEDTLFMNFDCMLSFLEKFRRQTSVGMMFRKGTTPGVITFSPMPELKEVLLREIQ